MPVDGRLPGRRADVDDAPVAPLAHARERTARIAAHVAHHVQLPHRLPVARRSARRSRPLHGDADVVDETVHAAERRSRPQRRAAGPSGLERSPGDAERRAGSARACSTRVAGPARTTTVAPSAASSRAVSRPMPAVEPVTTQTRSLSPRSMARPTIAAVTTILLARHGESDWNRAALAGPRRPAADARAAAHRRGAGRPARGASAAAVYSSDLRARARHRTGRRRCGTASRSIARQDLREVDVGSWSGRSRARARRPRSGAARPLGGRRAGLAGRRELRGDGRQARRGRLATSRRRTRTSTCSSFPTERHRGVHCTPARSASSSTHTGAAPVRAERPALPSVKIGGFGYCTCPKSSSRPPRWRRAPSAGRRPGADPASA